MYSQAPVECASPIEKKTSGVFRFNSAAPKCTVCAKTVYKMEEVSAVGRLWHNSCFTCGGGQADTAGSQSVGSGDLRIHYLLCFMFVVDG